jgi:hypothetical protein
VVEQPSVEDVAERPSVEDVAERPSVEDVARVCAATYAGCRPDQI